MANIWEHPQILAAEAMRHLEDSLVIVPMCARDMTSEFTTTANGWKVGDTVSFRTHGEYGVDEFAGSINVQQISTSSRSMTIEKLFDTSVEITAREEKLDLDSFSDQVIRPALYKMAETVDTYVGTKILQAAGMYVSSNLFTSAADIALARKAAIVQQLGMQRNCLVDLDLEAVLLGQTWFNQSQTRGQEGESTLSSGIMGRVMGMGFASSIAFPSSTQASVGTGVAATSATATDNEIGSTTLTTVVGTGTIVAGDRIIVAGVRRPLISAGAYDLTTDTVITLVDPITEIISASSAVTIVGSGSASLTPKAAIFDDRSLAVGFPMLEIPGDKVAAVGSSNGINVRIVKGYDINTKKTTLSIDMLAGSFALDPRRITLCAQSA